MTEAEYMRRLGLLFTEKQYKRCWLIMILLGCLSVVVFMAGLIIFIYAITDARRIIGGLIAICGIILIIIFAIYSFDNGVKIQLYHVYKKNPEKYEKEIDPSKTIR